MRFLVVGLGSMGKRRIRNLQYLAAGELAGFDPREDRRSEAHQKYGVRTFDALPTALAEFRPDALVISTPPDRHVEFAKIALERGLHSFMEAGVEDDGHHELEALAKMRPGVVVAPSCTMRYNASIKKMKELVASDTFGKPLLFTYHSGQWLPDWHPWEDYRTFYVSRRKTGACREIVPFELTWLTWLLGPIDGVTAMRAKLSSLDADIDDAYQLLLRFRSGLLGHLLVDVIARAPVRRFRLLSEETTLEWDGPARNVSVYRASTKAWEQIPEPAPIQEPGYVASENMYIEEMRDFVAACRGERPWPNPLAEELRVLELLRTAEAAVVPGAGGPA